MVVTKPASAAPPRPAMSPSGGEGALVLAGGGRRRAGCGGREGGEPGWRGGERRQPGQSNIYPCSSTNICRGARPSRSQRRRRPPGTRTASQRGGRRRGGRRRPEWFTSARSPTPPPSPACLFLSADQWLRFRPEPTSRPKKGRRGIEFSAAMALVLRRRCWPTRRRVLMPVVISASDAPVRARASSLAGRGRPDLHDQQKGPRKNHGRT